MILSIKPAALLAADKVVKHIDYHGSEKGRVEGLHRIDDGKERRLQFITNASVDNLTILQIQGLSVTVKQYLQPR